MKRAAKNVSTLITPIQMRNPMPKFIITYGFSYGGDDYQDVIEAENEDEATNMAYEAFIEMAESQGSYDVKKYDQENCENYGIKFEGGNDA
jgi:hypothetical protein